MDYLFQYLLFLAQAVTVVVAIGIVIAMAAGASARRQQPNQQGYLYIEKLNDELDAQRDYLRSNLLEKDALKRLLKTEEKAAKAESKQRRKNSQPPPKTESSASDTAEATAAEAAGSAAMPPLERLAGEPRLYVLDFDGDVQASRTDQLRREISALLTVIGEEDEVLLRLESPGGLVHSYGLAAAQLARLRERSVPLTVAVDRVAASGGYMMAAVADRILAAPFAVVGSVGVVAQVPNVHRLLKKNDVDVEVLTAGKYKRTLTVVGENTEEGRAKFLEELEVTHQLFQEHIDRYRPGLDLDEVATGEAWYGSRALALKLVDTLQTSDDYLLAAAREKDVYLVRWRIDKRPLERFMDGGLALWNRTLAPWMNRWLPSLSAEWRKDG